jgi:hypothetical protein
VLSKADYFLEAMIKETLDNRIRNNRNLGSLRYIVGSMGYAIVLVKAAIL